MTCSFIFIFISSVFLKALLLTDLDFMVVKCTKYSAKCNFWFNYLHQNNVSLTLKCITAESDKFNIGRVITLLKNIELLKKM